MTQDAHDENGNGAESGALDFYLTAQAPCPYLSGLAERRIVAFADTPQAAEAAPVLVQNGFRRSGTMFYRPHCPSCTACKSLRLRLSGFAPDAAERRILRKNAALSLHHGAATATPALYGLFMRYQQSRHADGEMAQMDEAAFADMIENHAGHARLMCARDAAGETVAAMLYDALPDGGSAVYSFFDSALSAQSPGTWMVLALAQALRAAGGEYLYLGYWIAASRKMAYKARFQPLEILLENEWKDFNAASF